MPTELQILEKTLNDLKVLVDLTVINFKQLNNFIETNFESYFFATAIEAYIKERAGNLEDILKKLSAVDAQENAIPTVTTEIKTIVNHPLRGHLTTTPKELFKKQDSELLRDLNPAPFFDALSPRNLLEPKILSLIKFIKKYKNIETKEDYYDWSSFNFLHLELLALYITNCAALISKIITFYWITLESKLEAVTDTKVKKDFAAIKEKLEVQAPLIYSQIINLVNKEIKDVLEEFRMQIPLKEIFFESARGQIKALSTYLRNVPEEKVPANKIKLYQKFLHSFSDALFQWDQALSKLTENSENFMIVVKNERNILADKTTVVSPLAKSDRKKQATLTLEQEFQHSKQRNLLQSLTTNTEAGFFERKKFSQNADKENRAPNEKKVEMGVKTKSLFSEQQDSFISYH